MYVHDGVVVAEERTLVIDGRHEASAFRVVHDHVTSVFRHDDLAAALAATELTEDDLDAADARASSWPADRAPGCTRSRWASASSCCPSTTNR